MQLEKIPYTSDSTHYFKKLKAIPQRVWLDSGKPGSNYGRFDILSAQPRKTLVNASTSDIEQAVKQLKAENQIVESVEIDGSDIDLPFLGGAIGYFNYNYNHDTFGLDTNPASSVRSIFGIFDWALIQDHEQRKAYVFFLASCSQDQRNRIRQCLENESEETLSPFQVDNLTNDTEKSDYLSALKQIHEYILSGDTYQINFSQRFSGQFTGAADTAYIALRQALPSPFSGYFELSDEIILSLSPERFIAIDQGHALTQPIKGTAPRGKTVEEDNKSANELINSDKNRAENLMIVDLLRNDFSKSCEPHSVKTSDLFALESFANVHHLVSTVTGKLKSGVSPLTFFLHCFPGGSITGAPKKRAMEIINELEQSTREIYCGSIAYLSTHGKLDSNITIRTLLVKQGEIFCWGGGGIVYDSQPEEEYEESLQKVRVLLDTLQSGTAG